MKRYFIEISYNGSDFFGWQRQPRQISVQEVIEDSLSKIHSNQPISIVGCGRTDTGVHAKQYFFHVDLDEKIVDGQFAFKLNRMLPNSIVVHKIEMVIDKHARFDAKKRTYRYFIHQKKDAFINEFSWYMPVQIDIERMNRAAGFLIGEMDFTSLSKLHTDVKTNICHVYSTHWGEEKNQLYFEISADRFLRNMVRATVGTLIDVGTGKLEPEDIQSILEAKDRQAASMSVPAHGLFLWKIDY
jgi:tRNA pseudouridine38-40 synthase